MTCENCRLDAKIQKFNLEFMEKHKDHPYKIPLSLEEGEGHDGCKGCTCQHLPVGSVEFLGSNPSRSIG